MGSYGIGVSRLVGAIIEAKYDEKKEIMMWPILIAPYHCAILPFINKNDNKNLEKSINIFKFLKSKNIDTIIDDSDDTLSAKMKKFDLIGIPFQIIIGKNTSENTFEFKKVGGKIDKLDLNQIIKTINKKN